MSLETEKILKLLGLEDKRKAQSHTLSGGMKRKLSVSIAFCANSKVKLVLPRELYLQETSFNLS